MTNASMSPKKRNRSTSTASSAQPDPSKILASKLNKLRSTSLALFSRLTNSVNISTTSSRSNHLRRERSFSFATSATEHRNLDTLVRDPRLLDRVNRYRSSQVNVKTYSESSIEEYNVLTVSNDPSDKKRYDNVIQTQWRRARDGTTNTDRLQVPMSTPHPVLQRAGLSHDANPELTVKSEELTAREFADMTGIKIISDDEHDDGYRSDVMTTHTMDRVETRGSALTADVLHQSSITTTSSIHSTEAWSIKSKPQIWDSGFWQKPDSCMPQCSPCQHPIPIHITPQKIDDKPRPQSTTTSSEDTTSTMLSTGFSCKTASSCASSIDSELLSSSPRTHDDNNVAEPPFISQLRRTSCASAIKRNEQGGVIIKKGRFHICLGDTQDTHIPSSSDEECIREWKRKSFVTAVDDNTLLATTKA